MENPKNNNISKKNKQFELFGSKTNTSINFQHTNNLKIKGETLTEWRNKIHNHQLKISEDSHNTNFQQTIFPVNKSIVYILDKLSLTINLFSICAKYKIGLFFFSFLL